MGIGASWSAVDSGAVCPVSIAWILTQKTTFFTLHGDLALADTGTFQTKSLRNMRQTDKKDTYATWKPSFVMPSVASPSPRSSAACPKSQGPPE